jgi:hypothetical protein
MSRQTLLLCTLGAAAAIAGCATTADRERELRVEFGEAARNCGLPRHEVEIDRRARLIRISFRQRSNVRGEAEASGALNCLRHWAEERNYRLATSPDEDPNY